MDQAKQPLTPGLMARQVLGGPRSRITDISWSPNGSSLACSFDNGATLLWDTLTWSKRLTLKGFAPVSKVVWSPENRILVSGHRNGSLRNWNTVNGEAITVFGSHENSISCLAWSNDGTHLASGALDRTIRIWDMENRREVRRLVSRVNSLAFSPSGQTLASASIDHSISIWDTDSGINLKTLSGHSGSVEAVVWSPNGRTVASASHDRTIRIWDVMSWRAVAILEGHTSAIEALSFSHDGSIMASQGDHLRLWDCNTWTTITVLSDFGAELEAPVTKDTLTGLAFHPNGNALAVVSKDRREVAILEYDLPLLLSNAPTSEVVKYSNAKVVLVGDSGVGKSGLGFALAEPPFRPTFSTHGRHVWTFEQKSVLLDDGVRELREILLWDLAGQAGYRLVHQLHLNEVAVAMVVFDSRSESDPFSGVRHWERCLRQANMVQGNSNMPIKKFLVAARTDRGGVCASESRIQKVKAALSFDEYFATSAKEGWCISELSDAIKTAIVWSKLPKVSSTAVFQEIKTFIVDQKRDGIVLRTIDDLYGAFADDYSQRKNDPELRRQFETCLYLVESRDLIKRLSFGNLILLHPELLDAYASAVVNAAKVEPDGLGCIGEDDVRNGRFPIPKDDRVADKTIESVLLIATIEDLLKHEIGIREDLEDRPHLVFPSQLTRENAEMPEPEGKAMIFRFEGPIQNIYATLSVRLSRSGIFSKDDMWRNATIFKAEKTGTYGIYLREIDEGCGELTTFYSAKSDKDTRAKFESYIELHLVRWALPGSIAKKRVIICTGCGFVVSEQMIRLQSERGIYSMACPICKINLSLRGQEGRMDESDEAVPAMDRSADASRDRDAASVMLQGKIATGDFDVFLCHNSQDKKEVMTIGRQLKLFGIYPWLDEWNVRPGSRWQRELESQVGSIRAAAVFIGRKGLGPWQDLEQEALLAQFIKRKCPVVPVILATCRSKLPEVPTFLAALHSVDFRKADPDPIRQLIWGIKRS